MRVYDIKADLESLAEETAFKEVNKTKSNVYLFDTDFFEQKDPDLVPENYALTEAELLEQAQLVSRLRSKFEEAGIAILQKDAQDSEAASELFN